jgi:predicted Rossmann-fold nucleotide-binding protein
MATDFACEMVRQGFMLIAGGSDGIMGAVQRGHFTGLLCSGEIVQRTAIPKENDELETLDLPRLIFTPIRSRFGRFRQLIDAINCSPTM